MFATPAMEKAVELIAPDRIASDLACARCGYNLRSLPAAGRCTECGLSIQTTLAVPSPEWANYEWVSRVRLGTILLLAGQLILVAGLIALAVPENDSRWIFAGALAIDGAGGALLVWPARGLESDRRLTRLRVGALITCALPMVAVALPRLFPLLGSWPICVFCCFSYLRRLAERAGWNESANFAKRVSLCLPGTMVLLSPLAAAYFGWTNRPSRSSLGVLGIAGAIALFTWAGAVNSLLDFISRLERHRRTLEEQDALAGKS
jgi:hypothetical protein